jgi:hypothetical protein
MTVRCKEESGYKRKGSEKRRIFLITLLLLYNLHRFRVLSKGVAGG